jgi:CRISPR-associated protein Csm2
MTNGYKKPYRSQGQGHRERPKGLPPGYLEGGYFDSSGHIKEELLTKAASGIAKDLGLGYPKMTNGQLRRFYGHVKTAEKAYYFHPDQKKLVLDIKTLDSFVAEAQGKGKVPKEFYQFIKKNIDTITNERDVLKGFLPHFQSVVAYFTYHYPKK